MSAFTPPPLGQTPDHTASRAGTHPGDEPAASLAEHLGFAAKYRNYIEQTACSIAGIWVHTQIRKHVAVVTMAAILMPLQVW